MSSPHLTDAEVAEITDPLRQPAARRKFFAQHGCKVLEKPNGQPLVSRADWEAVLAARRPGEAQAGPDATVIDWDKVREIGARKRRSGSVVG